jgi:hypothetical protein
MATNKPSGLPTPPESPRANSSQTPRDKVRDWLPASAQKSSPEGTPYTVISPSTPAWKSTVSKKA